MSGAIHRLLHLLHELDYEPRRSGKGWCCRCPAHEDQRPSLSIGEGKDGRVLVKCHAGCELRAILTAIGLREPDLFADDPTRRNGHVAKPRAASPRPAPEGRTFTTPNEAVEALERTHGPRSALWTYHNAADEPVGLVVRWNTPTGKVVRPVSRKADGSGWCIGGMPDRRPLYSLPLLLTEPLVTRCYVAEGEKCADALDAIGLLATTSSGGSCAAAKTDWSPLRGRDVVIVTDHDEAGERYAHDVVRLALAASAKSVRVVRLAELWDALPESGDVVDFIEHRGGAGDAVRTAIEALAERTEPEAIDNGVRAPALAWRPFLVDTLPEPIRSFVVEVAAAIGCDPSYVALPLLAALASAIGNTHRILLKRGWTEPAILWMAIVGESGTHKTPAFKAAMKAIRKAQADAFKQYEAARAEWDVQSLRYDAELAAWKRQAAKGRDDADDPPEKPEAPTARRFIVNDTTTEALAPILLANPSGVLLARDELAGWIGSFDRYSKAGRAGADSAHWLSMHSGEAMTIDRKTGNPPTIHVPSAAVSIAGGIQPGILARAMGLEHHESGLLARVLFSMPPRRVKRWSESDVSADTEAALFRRCSIGCSRWSPSARPAASGPIC